MANKITAPTLTDRTFVDLARYAFLTILLIGMMLMQAAGADQGLSIWLAILFLFLSTAGLPVRTLRERLCVPLFALLGYMLVNALAGLYSRVGYLAVSDFSKIFASFLVCALVLVRMRQTDHKGFAAVLSTASGIFALVSIDASSCQILSRAYIAVEAALGTVYTPDMIGYETGVRVTGIFTNANILGGILAFGVLLSLYLVQAAASRRPRFGACLLLGLNALGFLLAFSMGALTMFAVSVLVYLAMTRRGQRVPLFLLMLETAVITLLMAFIAFMGLGATGFRAFLPVAAALLCGPLLFILHTCAGERFHQKRLQHTRAAVITALCCAIALALYVILAFQITGSYTLKPDEALRRAAYPAPGAVTVTAEVQGAVHLTVESQNIADAMMHTSTMLYDGAVENAAFTVPEDSKVVYFTLQSPSGAVLSSLKLSDGTEVPLRYRLLPGFIANRLQGLRVNQNAIQRFVFWRDGLRLYAQSPLIGNGLGSVEGLVPSVQDFYYVSRYVHNHYVQVLEEMGLPGLLCFALLIGSSVVTLLKRRKESGTEKDALLPAMAACLAMMAGHGAVEVVWSISTYQTFALLILTALIVLYGRPVARLAAGKAAGWTAAGAIWAYAVVFTLLLYGNLSANQRYEAIISGAQPQTADSMSMLARIDAYEWPQYKLDYAVNAARSPVPEYAQTARQYAAELRKLGLYSVNNTLAAQHYIPLGEIEQAFDASREGLRQVASIEERWQEQFLSYEQVLAPYGGAIPGNPAWFAGQIEKTCDQLAALNRNRMQPISLSIQNSSFLGRIHKLISAPELPPESILRGLLFDSASAADIDGNGIPDLLSAQSGSLTAEDAGALRVTAGTTLDLAFFSYYAGNYTLSLQIDAPDPGVSAWLDGAPLTLAAQNGSYTAGVLLPEDGGKERHMTLTFDSDLTIKNLSLQQMAESSGR